MTTQQTANTRIPAPIYAAAGVGDLAYQQFRKLPTVVGELRGRAMASGFELRDKASTSLKNAETTATSLREKASATELDRLRDKATSNAMALAQAAQERAAAVYTALVAHGERVVGSGIVQSADVVNADIEATEDPKPITANASGFDESTEAKARAKRSRTTAK